MGAAIVMAALCAGCTIIARRAVTTMTTIAALVRADRMQPWRGGVAARARRWRGNTFRTVRTMARRTTTRELAVRARALRRMARFALRVVTERSRVTVVALRTFGVTARRAGHLRSVTRLASGLRGRRVRLTVAARALGVTAAHLLLLLRVTARTQRRARAMQIERVRAMAIGALHTFRVGDLIGARVLQAMAALTRLHDARRRRRVRLVTARAGLTLVCRMHGLHLGVTARARVRADQQRARATAVGRVTTGAICMFSDVRGCERALRVATIAARLRAFWSVRRVTIRARGVTAHRARPLMIRMTTGARRHRRRARVMAAVTGRAGRVTTHGLWMHRRSLRRVTGVTTGAGERRVLAAGVRLMATTTIGDRRLRRQSAVPPPVTRLDRRMTPYAFGAAQRVLGVHRVAAGALGLVGGVVLHHRRADLRALTVTAHAPLGRMRRRERMTGQTRGRHLRAAMVRARVLSGVAGHAHRGLRRALEAALVAMTALCTFFHVHCMHRHDARLLPRHRHGLAWQLRWITPRPHPPTERHEQRKQREPQPDPTRFPGHAHRT